MSSKSLIIMVWYLMITSFVLLFCFPLHCFTILSNLLDLQPADILSLLSFLVIRLEKLCRDFRWGCPGGFQDRLLKWDLFTILFVLSIRRWSVVWFLKTDFGGNITLGRLHILLILYWSLCLWGSFSCAVETLYSYFCLWYSFYSI